MGSNGSQIKAEGTTEKEAIENFKELIYQQYPKKNILSMDDKTLLPAIKDTIEIVYDGNKYIVSCLEKY
uniref:Uncharacterized protein n=1 Tax=Marseillevirus LCMAC102 TaxID=2506603 RepID=A0A481YTM2_9VIRU|nr:MAG: hypothetical protein LCMAC102_00460 [Marseillevirus LCMAC102]